MTTRCPCSPSGGGDPCLTGTNRASAKRRHRAQAAPKPSAHSAWYKTTVGASGKCCREGDWPMEFEHITGFWETKGSFVEKIKEEREGDWQEAFPLPWSRQTVARSLGF